MNRLLTSLLVAWLLCCQVAGAQELGKPPAIPPGPDLILTLRKGQPAPQDGQLFDNETALRWANWLEWYRMMRPLDRDTYLRVAAVESQYKGKLLDIEKQRAAAVERDLFARLQASEQRVADLQLQINDPPWYRNPVVNLLFGVLGTTVIFCLGVYAASKL